MAEGLQAGRLTSLGAGRSLHSSRPCLSRRCQLPRRAPVTQALFGWGKKDPEAEADREEAYRVQQEVLARRRTNSWQKEVADRRADVKRYNTDKAYKKKVDDERRRNKPKVEEPPKFSIIIPLAPFGMPEYDNGERFDLRAPYCDQGWEDPDADFFKQVGRLFGGNKKKNTESDPDNSKSSSKKK